MKLKPERVNALVKERVKAFLYDYLIIAAYLMVLVGIGSLLSALAPSVAEAMFRSPLQGQGIAFLVLTLPVILYFTLQEAAPARGSWGKRKVGLAVVTLDGQRASLGQCLVRSIVKFVPWELTHTVIWHSWQAPDTWESMQTLGLAMVWILVAAYALGAAIGSRRTLYDVASGTRVVRQTERAGGHV